MQPQWAPEWHKIPTNNFQFMLSAAMQQCNSCYEVKLFLFHISWLVTWLDDSGIKLELVWDIQGKTWDLPVYSHLCCLMERLPSKMWFVMWCISHMLIILGLLYNESFPFNYCDSLHLHWHCSVLCWPNSHICSILQDVTLWIDFSFHLQNRDLLATFQKCKMKVFYLFVFLSIILNRWSWLERGASACTLVVFGLPPQSVSSQFE